MTIDSMDIPKRLCFDGRIATLTKARKAHECKVCPEPIAPGEHYYAVVIGGGGLCSIKWPDRFHVDCLGGGSKVSRQLASIPATIENGNGFKSRPPTERDGCTTFRPPTERDGCTTFVEQYEVSRFLKGRDIPHTNPFIVLDNGDIMHNSGVIIQITSQERLDRNNAIFDHWLAGETIEEIAKSGKIGHSQVANIINHSIKTKRGGTGIVEQPPIYNVWNISSCNPRFGQSHPGRIPGQAIVNLLLWLTEPFNIVVDPMAGGGTTIDVCRYLLRRYYCFDIDPKRLCFDRRIAPGEHYYAVVIGGGGLGSMKFPRRVHVDCLGVE